MEAQRECLTNGVSYLDLGLDTHTDTHAAVYVCVVGFAFGLLDRPTPKTKTANGIFLDS